MQQQEYESIETRRRQTELLFRNERSLAADPFFFVITIVIFRNTIICIIIEFFFSSIIYWILNFFIRLGDVSVAIVFITNIQPQSYRLLLSVWPYEICLLICCSIFHLFAGKSRHRFRQFTFTTTSACKRTLPFQCSIGVRKSMFIYSNFFLLIFSPFNRRNAMHELLDSSFSFSCHFIFAIVTVRHAISFVR